MNVTIHDLLRIIGEKEVALIIAQQQLAQAQRRVAELEKPPEVPRA